MSAPDVTVVVISYNDAARLPRALASIQRQTLRAIEIIVVDDASTDGTEEIVRRIAEVDPRVRYERLAVNSGGCSTPRNTGIDLATAPWVMFCDSDDEYERHACKNLLAAAESTGADVVCGTAERIDVRTGRTRRWRPEVHDRNAVVEALSDFPELLFDTISVNKIYRTGLLRGSGIRFPEGLLFEDQLFTLEAMAAAQRIATIPETVYRWYVDRLSDEPSITQRRNEVRNVESRIEINRRIDGFLAGRGLTQVQEAKDLKFLKHDLYLYLSSMLELDDDTAMPLMDRLVPYVQQVNLAPAWRLRPALRVAIYHLLVRDLEGIRSAMRFVKWASVVDAPIVQLDGREWWGSRHLDHGVDVAGIPTRDWLDVTGLRLTSIPFSQRRYLHRVDGFTVSGDRVCVTGSTVDYDGLLAESDAVEVRFLISGTRTGMSLAGEWLGYDGCHRQWRAEGVVTDRIGRRLEAKDRGTLGVAVMRDGQVNVVSARSAESDVPSVCVRFPGRVHGIGPDHVELVAHDNGAIGWRAARPAGARARRAALKAGWFRIPGTTWLAAGFALIGRDMVPAVATRLGHLLPRRDLVILEADGGRSFGGNVGAISGGLAVARPGMRQVWVHRATPESVPGSAEVVRRGTLRHAWLRARASVVVDDGSTTAAASPRASVVNAGHGVSVHRIGLDDPSVLVSRSAVTSIRRRARQWTVVVAASMSEAAVIARAFGYRGRVAEAGLPRMDSAVGIRPDDGARAELRRRLDLPDDRAVVVYAPSGRGGASSGEPLIDLDRWDRDIGDRAYLVVRANAFDSAVPTRLRSAVRELSETDDFGLVLAASDLFISDYSSLIGDAALIDLPIVLFQPDREMYVNRTRGLYAGLGDVGPETEGMDALFAEVTGWIDDPAGWDQGHAARRQAWTVEHCGPRDGRATERAIDAIGLSGEAT